MMQDDNYNYELYHWGIKGMKWGVRRYQKADGTRTAAGKKRRKNRRGDIHEDYARAHDGRSVKELSDKELRDRNNRLQMERQHADLTKKTSKGKKFVQGFIATAGTLVALEGAYKTYKRFGNGALDGIGDWVIRSIDLKNLA